MGWTWHVTSVFAQRLGRAGAQSLPTIPTSAPLLAQLPNPSPPPLLAVSYFRAFTGSPVLYPFASSATRAAAAQAMSMRSPTTPHSAPLKPSRYFHPG
jgi:hypothetical protein